MDDPVAQATRALRDGHLVVYPTDTLYGLGCLAEDPEAFSRLSRVKGLPMDRGVSVVVHDLDQAEAWTAWTPLAQQLAEAFLPGGLTLILEASETAPDHLLAPEGTLGIRLVDRPEPLALAAIGPVVSTSANRHGAPSVTTIAQARKVFGDQVAAYVDAGPLTGPASTVVDARGSAPKVIREGAIPEQEIQEAPQRGR